MFCQYCGSKIKDEAVFCPKCGKKVPSDARPVAGQDSETSADETSVIGNGANASETRQFNDADATQQATIPVEPTEAMPRPAEQAAYEQSAQGPASPAGDAQAATAQSQPQPQQQAIAPATPKKKHTAALVLSIIAIVAVLLFGGAAILWATCPGFFSFIHINVTGTGSSAATSSSSETVITISDVPDEEWADYLSDNVDRDGDGLITQAEADRITEIGSLSQSLSYGNGLCDTYISELTGIEYFTNLRTLLCSSSLIGSLDLSHNTKLRTLDCSNNVLTELKLPATDSLTTVHAYLNELSELDVSECTGLTDLLVDEGVTVTGWSGDESDYTFSLNDDAELLYDYDDEYDEYGDGFEDLYGELDEGGSSSDGDDLATTSFTA